MQVTPVSELRSSRRLSREWKAPGLASRLCRPPPSQPIALHPRRYCVKRSRQLRPSCERLFQPDIAGSPVASQRRPRVYRLATSMDDTPAVCGMAVAQPTRAALALSSALRSSLSHTRIDGFPRLLHLPLRCRHGPRGTAPRRLAGSAGPCRGRRSPAGGTRVPLHPAALLGAALAHSLARMCVPLSPPSPCPLRLARTNPGTRRGGYALLGFTISWRLHPPRAHAEGFESEYAQPIQQHRAR